MLIITAPGQGAQTPGFLAPWLEVPGVAERLGAASELAGCDLIRFGTTGDAEAIKDTAVAQPLVVAMSLFVARELGGLPGPVARPPADVVRRAQRRRADRRGRWPECSSRRAMRAGRGPRPGMAAAAAAEPTGMTAVLGGDPDEVLAALDRHGLTPANVNGAGQVVAAGR